MQSSIRWPIFNVLLPIYERPIIDVCITNGHHSHLLYDSANVVSQLTRDSDNLPFGAGSVLGKHSYSEL